MDPCRRRVRLPTTPTVYLRERGTTRTLRRFGAISPSSAERRASTAEPASSSSVAQAGWSTETTSSPSRTRSGRTSRATSGPTTPSQQLVTRPRTSASSKPRCRSNRSTAAPIGTAEAASGSEPRGPVAVDSPCTRPGSAPGRLTGRAYRRPDARRAWATPPAAAPPPLSRRPALRAARPRVPGLSPRQVPKRHHPRAAPVLPP